MFSFGSHSQEPPRPSSSGWVNKLSTSHRSRDEARRAQKRPQSLAPTRVLPDGTESSLGETKPASKRSSCDIPMRGRRIHER